MRIPSYKQNHFLRLKIIPKLQQDDMKNVQSKFYLTLGLAQTVVLVAINNRYCEQQQQQKQ